MHDLKIKKFYLCISIGHTFSPSIFLGNFKGVNIAFLKHKVNEKPSSFHKETYFILPFGLRLHKKKQKIMYAPCNLANTKTNLK